MPGDPVPGMDGYVFDEACGIVPAEVPEILFAVAYTDIDPSDEGYNADVDVLIAKFIDGNGNGIPDVGDKLVAGQYPTSQTAPIGSMPSAVKWAKSTRSSLSHDVH